MTACDQIRDDFSAVVDGEFDAATRAVFDDHLSRCAACAVLFRQFQSAVAAVQHVERAELSDLGRARIKRALRDARRDALRAAAGDRRGTRAWFGYGAAAALLVTAGYTIGAYVGMPTPVPVVQALPNPDPILRLRDAKNGGWIDVDELVTALDRHSRAVQVQPRLRVEPELAQARLERERQRVVDALAERGVPIQRVRFVEPLTVDDNLLNGPEVELWVDELPQVVPAAQLR